MSKKILTVLLLVSICSCATNKKIQEKDYLEKGKSFAVMSFFGNDVSGYAYKFGTSYNFNSTKNDWDVNNHIEIAMRKLFDSESLVLQKVSYSAEPFKESDKFFKNLESENKILPDYYIIIAPRETQKDDITTHWYSYNSNNPVMLPVLLVDVLIRGVDYTRVKYSDLNVPQDLLQQTLKEQPDTNFRIFSVALGKMHSSCNVSFDLFLIDRKKNKLIAFEKNRTSINELPEYYDVNKFSSFSNFTPKEQDGIKSGCLEALDKGIIESLLRIELIKRPQ